MSEDIEVPSRNIYDRDFYAWTQEQSHLLSSHQWQKLDIANLVEEIESLGKQQRQELRNRLGVLIGHLLKWEYQIERRSHSWLATIRTQRRELIILLKENPSLKSYIQEGLLDGYQNGRDLASGETNLDVKIFPEYCHYSLQEVLDDRFLPKGEDF